MPDPDPFQDVEALAVPGGGWLARTGVEVGPGDQIARWAALYEPGETVPRGTWRLIASGAAWALANERGAGLDLAAFTARSRGLMARWLEAELDGPRVEVGDRRRFLGPDELTG